VSQKKRATLASCIFDKHGLILIILGKQRQHTFKNDMRTQFFLSLHFSLLYLLLNCCDGNDATSTTWSSAHWQTGKHITQRHRRSCWSM